MKSLIVFKVLILPILGGIFYAMGIPSLIYCKFALGPILGVSCLLYSLQLFESDKCKISYKLNFVSLILFLLTVNYLGFYWIAFTVQEFGSIYPPFNYAISSLFSLIAMPGYWSFIIILFLFRKFDRRKSNKLIFSENTSIFLLGCILTICELYTPMLFPIRIGDTFLNYKEYLGLASIVGQPAYSFFSFLLSASIVLMFKRKRIKYFFPSIFFIFLFANYILVTNNMNNDQYKELNIRVVQGNIGNHLKLASEEISYSEAYNRVTKKYHDLSLKDAEHDIDLLVWPETSYPHYFNDYEKVAPLYFWRIVNSLQADIIFGGYTQILKDRNDPYYFEDVYNSVFFIDSLGEIRSKYHKKVLLPFGETLPFGPLNKILHKYIDNISYFARGKEYNSFELKKGLQAIPLICYEVLISSLVRNALKDLKPGYHLLVNLTNDSWFGDSSEPEAHLFLSQWRALEYKIPVIRSTNTGITTVLRPDGQEEIRLPFEKEGVLDLTLKVPFRSASFYEKWGILVTIFIGFIILLIIKLFEKFQLKNLPVKDHEVV